MAESDPNALDKLNEQAREHAWTWFALHANQRMQSFNFFLVATAFLVAAYGALLEKHQAAAAAVAIAGAWLAFWFSRLDIRSRQLVKASEAALRIIAQARLAGQTGIPELKIVDAVEIPTRGGSSYRIVIAVIQWSILVIFLSAAAYAICA